MPSLTLAKRATHGNQGGLSYEAITAITICVAGFVMLMVLACAINLRRRTGEPGAVDAGDLGPEQQTYMREVRYRNRDTLTGTNHFTSAAASSAPSRQPTNYMSRSAMSGYGYDDVYTPGWESGYNTKRNSAYVDNSPDGDYGRSPDAADVEYFNHGAPTGHATGPYHPDEFEKPQSSAAVHDVATPYTPDEQYHVGPKA